MKIIDLLNKIANREGVPKKIKFNGDIFQFTGYNSASKNYKNELEDLFECLDGSMLNDEVEILKEGKELHANDIEFNINNDKRDCIITLDENDLGIDKLHLDNCYFYKENDKWYVKKYDFKSFKLEEEKKIPEKLQLSSHWFGTFEDEQKYRNKRDDEIAFKINEIIDYLKNKGDE